MKTITFDESQYRLVPVEPTQEMIRAMLAAKWPALYRNSLRTEHDGPVLLAKTAERVELAMRAHAAALAAASQPLAHDCSADETIKDCPSGEAPENLREGDPYDEPRFEALCREYGIWGTPDAALAAVFWRVVRQDPLFKSYKKPSRAWLAHKLSICDDSNCQAGVSTAQPSQDNASPYFGVIPTKNDAAKKENS